uniref:Uncharacterized protein n=1 Tax=Peronospora matthiolae TaxID=2874970 RepID=A0AAV1TI03_9STRA
MSKKNAAPSGAHLSHFDPSALDRRDAEGGLRLDWLEHTTVGKRR